MIISMPFNDETEHDAVTIILEDGRVIEIDEDRLTTYADEQCQVPVQRMEIKSLFD